MKFSSNRYCKSKAHKRHPILSVTETNKQELYEKCKNIKPIGCENSTLIYIL